MPREDALVQPIVVVPSEHWHTVAAVAAASAQLLARRFVLPEEGPRAPSEDERARWAQWLAVAFTKTVRRAKNKAALTRVIDDMVAAGYSFETSCIYDDETGAACEAVAFEPLRYADFPKSLARLQVSGLDRPASGLRWDLHGHEGEEVSEPVVLLSDASLVGKLDAGMPFVLDESLAPVSTGKIAAQAAHALGVWLLTQPEEAVAEWLIRPRASFRRFSPEDEEMLLSQQDASGHRWAAIRDHGLTEVDAGTVTAIVKVRVPRASAA